MAIVVIEHSPTAGAERLAAALRDHGHPLRVVNPAAGDPLPPDLDDVDGVVTTGGPQSATDADGWVEAELDLLRRADAASLPVIGLCLGSQLLGRALGGEVGPVEGGIELGWHEVTLTPAGAEDPVHAGIAWTSKQLHWHREQVTTPPPGARVLARSERCPVQCWVKGLRTYAFQYHPEVTVETIERWAAEEPDALAEAGLTIEQLREDTADCFPAFQRLTDRLFESICLYLAPLDRRYQGLVKDLHH